MSPSCFRVTITTSPVTVSNNVREFYSKLPRPVRVGIEATGSMQWFLNLMEDVMRLLAHHKA